MHSPRAVRILVAALALALAFPVLAAPASSPVAEAVIPAGSSEFFLEAANPAPKTFPGGWRLEGVRIQWVSAVVTYANGARKLAVIELTHPSAQGKPLAVTERFALTAPDPAAVPPAALVKILAERLKTRESAFTWVRQIRSDAVPIDPLNRERYDVSDPAVAARLKEARDALAAGRAAEAAAKAREAAAAPLADLTALRSAADILRSAGGAPEAVAILDRAGARAAGTPVDLRVRLERLAALEVVGDHESASASARTLSASLPRVYPDPRCARADALAILLQAGQGAEAARAAASEPDAVVAAPKAPRCVYLYLLRAASASGDGDAVDARAGEALAAYPDDPDVLFLWGTHFYVRNQLDRAIPPWDRLAAIDPTYPSLMSQYGTAYLVAGRIDKTGIEHFLARHKEHPEDAVAAYLAGLGLYYQKDFAQVIPLLEQASKAVPNDPRPAMYLAMAHFFMGHRDVTIRMLDALEPFAYQEPDINYCRSLFYRSFDLPRAIKEMEIFLRVFEGEKRLRFGQQKVDKARSDLERMKRGEVPEVWLPQPDGPDDKMKALSK